VTRSAGVPFMQVVDPSIMEVQVPVNQEDLLGLKLAESTRASGRILDLIFEGQLESVDRWAERATFLQASQLLATFSIKGTIRDSCLTIGVG